MVVYVIDASVWVSRFLPEDVHHELSVRCTSQIVESRTPIYAPAVLLPEVAGSVSRVSGSYESGVNAATYLTDTVNIQLIQQDSEAWFATALLAARLRLRGCDASYVYVAAEMNATLVSLDAQQIERASQAVPAMQPSDPMPN